MPVFTLIIAVLLLAVAAYVVCRQRVLARAGGNPRLLHSLPNYYGWYGFIMVAVPSLMVLAVWLIVQPLWIERSLAGLFPPEVVQDDSARTLLMADVRRVAGGLDVAVAQGALTEEKADMIRTEFGSVRDTLASVGVALGAEVTPPVLAAAQDYREMARMGALGRTLLTAVIAMAGLAWAFSVCAPDFRARNRVEQVILGLLMLASLIAILTTVGIVLSMLSESIRFFGMYPFADFLFGLTWSPAFRGGSELGLIPLLWGTMYISIVSMIVSVPIGLFTAIYLAEYASKPVRNVVKPLIEVIAGIPTVVFGLFALVTVGPFLRDWFAQPLGLGNSGSSVMTAGIVIGILNIPFISSLADDIINAVPQSMRDGSLGLGATKSETIRQVVLPAALPGIVGAVLMAASRAIGETMVVTMGAGAAAKLDLNPFEAMTTITVKIVSQLTGDTEFNSPETLVAFALGMSLFVITLGLNIFALWIVRKYREQYRMTDATAQGMPAAAARPKSSLLAQDALMRRRNAAEQRFKVYGIAAIAVSLVVLAIMLFTIFRDGTSAFRQATLTFPVTLDAAVLDKSGNRDLAEMSKVTTVGYAKVLTTSFLAELKARGIAVEGVSDKNAGEMISKEAPARLRDMVLADPSLVGQTIVFNAYATGRIDGYLKGRVTMESAERDSNVSPQQLQLADRLTEAGILRTSFNTGFLTNTDASDQRPEASGLGIAIIGSAYMMLLVLIMTLPVGVAASIYLEEFAPKNWITDLIEVNISNLAAVPSIVFGILGLAIFINFMGLPQSSSLVGALVISLMTLPTIIIATRASIRAVPPSIRDAALGIGASKMQTVFHHVLPLAMPGILTGTILGLASALGETAPLLLIGMVAFVTNYPSGPFDGGVMDPATALPVQVYSWASRADPAFIERSSGAIIVLLAFLVIMNVGAILLRRRFERRW